MCEWCMKHGSGGKWYMNAKNYSYELVDKYNLREYLSEQWMNFENVFIRKIMGMSSIGLGYKLQMPIAGRVIRKAVEGMIHHDKPASGNPVRADGHFGQAVPLEDAKAILGNLAAEPIISNYCMCRMMQRGVKDVCCINFGALSEVIEKLPRFLPDQKGANNHRLDRDEAIALVEEQNKKGRIASVWFQPVPYINAICSCEKPQCGGLRLRTDFKLNSFYKAEYVVEVDPDMCQGCKECIAMCQFGAINYSPTLDRVIIDQDQCFGCGVCRHACTHDALELKPRENHPTLNNSF